jgi:transposase
MVRLQFDPRTKAYAERRRAEGKTYREIVRCLKRFIAREVFGHLTRPKAVPLGSLLRETRNAARISLKTAATALATQQIRISRLERALDFDRDFALRYQTWLSEQLVA